MVSAGVPSLPFWPLPSPLDRTKAGATELLAVSKRRVHTHDVLAPRQHSHAYMLFETHSGHGPLHRAKTATLPHSPCDQPQATYECKRELFLDGDNNPPLPECRATPRELLADATLLCQSISTWRASDWSNMVSATSCMRRAKCKLLRDQVAAMPMGDKLKMFEIRLAIQACVLFQGRCFDRGTGLAGRSD